MDVSHPTGSGVALAVDVAVQSSAGAGEQKSAAKPAARPREKRRSAATARSSGKRAAGEAASSGEKSLTMIHFLKRGTSKDKCDEQQPELGVEGCGDQADAVVNQERGGSEPSVDDMDVKEAEAATQPIEHSQAQGQEEVTATPPDHVQQEIEQVELGRVEEDMVVPILAVTEELEAIPQMAFVSQFSTTLPGLPDLSEVRVKQIVKWMSVQWVGCSGIFSPLWHFVGLVACWLGGFSPLWHFVGLDFFLFDIYLFVYMFLVCVF